MGVPEDRQAGFLEHFQFDRAPFSSHGKTLGFLNAFGLDPDQPLSLEQAMVYIQFELNAAGPEHNITIEEGAYEKLHCLTSGHVSRIKAIMDQALDQAFKERGQKLCKAHMEDGFTDASKRGEKSRKHRVRILGLIIIALAVLSMGTALVLLNGNEENLLENKNTPKPGLPLKTKPPAAAAPSPSPKKSPEEPVQYSDEQVMDFLSKYQLEAYEPMFFSAIVSEDFREITKKIYTETGLMLIHFAALPAPVENQYVILKKILLNPVHTRYFLFWKPGFLISTYENGIKAEAIGRLQTLLKKLGLYTSRIDGVVDTELTRALIRFQRQHSLDQTGFPDPTTLFFLTALSQ